MAPSNGTVTCTGSTNCTVAKLNQQFAGYSCTPTFSCPAVPTVDNGVVSKTDGTNSCSYTLTCDTGFAVPGVAVTTYSCTGDNCTPANISNWANNLECKKLISCPTPNTIEHGNITKESINNGTACKYTINCNAPAYVCDANAGHCANGFTCETEEACNAWLSTTRSSTCVFRCPSIQYVASKIPHMSTYGWGLNTTDPIYDCKYAVGVCSNCYERANTGENNLHCDAEECNNSDWYSGADTCRWVGGSGCLDQ